MNRTTKAYLQGAPLAILGLACIATVILAIPGFALLVCSGIPLARVQTQIAEEQAQLGLEADRKRREEPLPEWVIEGLIDNEIHTNTAETSTETSTD